MQQKHAPNSSLPNVWFILLINTKSGGGWGKCYLQLKKQEFSFQYKGERIVNVKLVDLFDHDKKAKELQKAKQLQTIPNNDVRVIVCGGDGTIIWGIEECLKAQLNFQQLLIACLPIGTGNDFSRTIGWGSTPLQLKQGDILPLKKRIVEWLNSDTISYDVWEVEISVYDQGEIYVVKNKTDFLTDKKVHKTGFVNYVGIGIDARVTYNFQKNRKSTKLMNLAVYGYFGCFLCCKSFPELTNSLETFEEEECIQSEIESPAVLKEHNLEDSMIRHIDESGTTRSSRKINLKKGYHGLVCLNSISYMAGVMDCWETSKVGLNEKAPKFEKQKIDDGKIEFLSYTSEIILGMEKFFRTGYRVAQGSGPFVIRFKQDSLKYENYVQIDGEGLKFKGIKQIVIKRHEKIPSISLMSKRKQK